MNIKKNKAFALRKNILKLISFTIFVLTAVPIIIIPFSAKELNTKTVIMAILLINISAGVFIIRKSCKYLKLLKEYTLFDSNDINRIIAKNTAPVKKRYYILYSSKKEIEIKTALLRSTLEKLYSKLKDQK